VYIRLLSDFSIGSVKAKIAGELKNRKENGIFICYFEHLQELYKWSYKELRMLIKKSPDPDKTEPGSAGRDGGVHQPNLS